MISLMILYVKGLTQLAAAFIRAYRDVREVA